jgi:UDPglucose--hexose-1-phosphate uridylyltransferase
MPNHDGEQMRPIQTDHFQVFCPATSDWPDEVIIAPKRRRTRFGDATIDEIGDAAKTLQEVLHALSKHFKEEFPFNFYIYPLFDWYLRIIPREKVLGGFEMATTIPVVTRDPAQTMLLLRENLGK